MFGADCMAVTRTTQKCVLGGSVPLPFEECPRSRSRLCCNEMLASALILLPNGRGGRTSLDERDGMPVVHSESVRLQTFRPFTSLALNSYTTHSNVTILWNDWGNRGGMLIQVALFW